MATPNEVELFRFRLSRGFYAWNVHEVMNTITKNPKVLTNCGRTLALQRACDMDRNIVSVELIRLLIEEGRTQNFGERGGLRMCSNQSYGSAPLQVLAKRGSLRALTFLAEAKPPLLCREDVSNFNLLHFAAGYGHLDVVQFLMTLNPDASSCPDVNGVLPIHMTCNSRGDPDSMRKLATVREVFLQDYIQQHYVNHGSDDHHPVDLEMMEWFFPKSKNCSQEAVENYVRHVASIINRYTVARPSSSSSPMVSIPILSQAVRYGASQSHLKCIIDLIKDCAYVRDEHNRLPIHYAVENGTPWFGGLKEIVEANPCAVYEVDEISSMYPFILAAASSADTNSDKACDLDGIYQLMRRNPEPVVHY